jgi:hypothetical protein
VAELAAIISVQVVEETVTPSQLSSTLHFRGVKYLQYIFKLFLKYHAMMILLCVGVYVACLVVYVAVLILAYNKIITA